MSYESGFQTGLAGLSSLTNQFEEGRQRARQQEGDQMVRQQYADKRSAQSREDGIAQLGRVAAYLAAIPDPQSRAAAYAQVMPQIAPIGQQLGLPPLPQVWDESHLPELHMLAQMAGQGGSQSAPGVQSSFIDAQGNRVAIMRDGSTQVLGQNAPNLRPIQGDGGFYGYDPRTNTAAPTMVGGGGQMPQQGPQGQRVAFDFAPGTPQAVMDATRNYAAADQGVQNVPTQLRTVPKPVAPPAAPKPPSGYSWQPDGSLAAIPGGPAQVALDARKAAQDANRTATDVRQSEAAAQATQLVSAIDGLTKSPGFADLGTAMGDFKQGVPFIRNDAKNSAAQLHNIAGQVALTTMSRLKALSATGATGFGSLTEKELQLLQNSISTLQSDQIDNATLAASLKVIRDSMQKIADWKPGKAAPQQNAPTGPKVGETVDGYIYKGGPPSDPHSWTRANP